MANANVNSDEELSNELAEGLSEILNITELKVLKSSKKKTLYCMLVITITLNEKISIQQYLSVASSLIKLKS